MEEINWMNLGIWVVDIEQFKSWLHHGFLFIKMHIRKHPPDMILATGSIDF